MGSIVPRPDLVPDLSKSGDRALAKMFEDISQKAAENTKALIDGSSPDSQLPWGELSAQNRASFELYKAERAAARQTGEVHNHFGFVVVPGLLSIEDWEKQAREVNETRPDVIEAEVVEDGQGADQGAPGAPESAEAAPAEGGDRKQGP